MWLSILHNQGQEFSKVVQVELNFKIAVPLALAVRSRSHQSRDKGGTILQLNKPSDEKMFVLFQSHYIRSQQVSFPFSIKQSNVLA